MVQILTLCAKRVVSFSRRDVSEAVSKVCTRCRKRLSAELFHRDARSKDGRRSRCAVCTSVASRAASKREPGAQDGGNVKSCARCTRTLPLELFGVARRRLDGKNSWCKECCSRASLAWQRTPEGRVKHAAAVRRYNEKKRRERFS